MGSIRVDGFSKDWASSVLKVAAGGTVRSLYESMKPAMGSIRVDGISKDWASSMLKVPAGGTMKVPAGGTMKSLYDTIGTRWASEIVKPQKDWASSVLKVAAGGTVKSLYDTIGTRWAAEMLQTQAVSASKMITGVAVTAMYESLRPALGSAWAPDPTFTSAVSNLAGGMAAMRTALLMPPADLTSSSIDQIGSLLRDAPHEEAAVTETGLILPTPAETAILGSPRVETVETVALMVLLLPVVVLAPQVSAVFGHISNGILLLAMIKWLMRRAGGDGTPRP